MKRTHFLIQSLFIHLLSPTGKACRESVVTWVAQGEESTSPRQVGDRLLQILSRLWEISSFHIFILLFLSGGYGGTEAHGWGQGSVRGPPRNESSSLIPDCSVKEKRDERDYISLGDTPGRGSRRAPGGCLGLLGACLNRSRSEPCGTGSCWRFSLFIMRI